MRKVSSIGMVVILCLAIALVSNVIRGQRVRAASTGFKEFTMLRGERSQSQNPHPMERLVLEAYRADGSKVSGEVTSGEPGRPSRRFLSLTSEKIRIQVDDNLRAKTTWYHRNFPAPAPPNPDPRCGVSLLSPAANPSYLGESNVLGLRAVMIRTEHRMASGEYYTNTTWKAPDLDCVTLKVSEDRRDHAGQITGHFEMQAVAVTPGTPDPSLFEIPVDYAEKSPSQLSAAHLERLGHTRPIPQSMRLRLEREDQSYYDNHNAAGVR